jgi:hypothetical protein
MEPAVPPPVFIPGEPTIVLWLFFWLGFVVTLGYAFGLLYHWIRYGKMYPLALVMLPIYVVGVFIFIGAMLTSIATI